MSNEHISELRQKAEQELVDLESEFLRKREEILMANKKQIEKQFRAQELKEEEYVKKKEDDEEQYHSEIKRLKQTKYKEYFDLKLALENEIESHEKCLEDMRAIYTLNSVKLNYNFKVTITAGALRKEGRELGTGRNAEEEGAVLPEPAQEEERRVHLQRWADQTSSSSASTRS